MDIDGNDDDDDDEVDAEVGVAEEGAGDGVRSECTTATVEVRVPNMLGVVRIRDEPPVETPVDPLMS